MKSDLLDIDVVLIRETYGDGGNNKGAWLITHDGTRETWIPKAMAELATNDKGDGYVLSIPQHSAETKGLV